MAGVAFEGNKRETILQIGVPLRLINVGARPLILERLRLRLPSDLNVAPFDLERTEKDMFNMHSDHNWVPLPFAVNPNEAKHLDCIFVLRSSTFRFTAKNYTAELEAQCTGITDWRPILRFEMRFAESDTMTLHNLNHFFEAYPIRDTV